MTATETRTSVTVARSELARALKAAASIKAKAIHIDMTGHAVTVSAYTPETGVQVVLDAPLVEPVGAVFVPRVLFAGVLAYCGHEMTLTVNDDGTELAVESDESSFALRTRGEPVAPVRKGRRRRGALKPPPDRRETFGHDFTQTGSDPVVIEAPTLVETLRRVLPFASRDMTRPVLATVALFTGQRRAVATDSYRLAAVSYGDDAGPKDETPRLLHVQSAIALRSMLGRRLGPVTITATERYYLIEFEDTRWSLARVDGVYPQYLNLLPGESDYKTTLKIDRDDLLSASRAAGVVATRNAPLRLNVADGGATITAACADVGTFTRRLPSADSSGLDLEIGLNPDFVADFCAGAPVERLTVRLIACLRPLTVEAGRDVYLLMPIRLNV